jgi:uncharacterized protein (DUF1499 family)
VVAEVAPRVADRLWLYSRSLVGHSVFGVNRARVIDWLGAFEDRLRRG